MSREVCGICWCPYDEETGECACAPTPNEPELMVRQKPLTEEEIKKLLIEHAGMTVAFSEVDLRFARAIERAHGIGGSDE